MFRPALLVVAALSSLAAAATDPIEGRWTVNGGGAVIEIARAPGADERFSVTMVDSPDLKVAPGTVLGYACPAPATGRYDCHLSADPSPRHRRAGGRKVDFSIEFADGTSDAIIFSYYQKGRRISLWRWLPYLFRVTVSDPHRDSSGLDGARRLGAPPRTIVI